MKYEKLTKTLLASASLAALLAATPFYFDFNGKDGVSLKISQAFADDGENGDSDDGDSDDGDDEDSDNDEDEDEDEDEEDEDESDDDESDDDGDDESDDDDDESDDDGDDESDDDGDDESDDDGDDDSNEFLLPDGTKVEISGDGLNIELKYVDGSKEEIQNGVYEKKDATGTTIEERPATADDVARLQAIING